MLAPTATPQGSLEVACGDQGELILSFRGVLKATTIHEIWLQARHELGRRSLSQGVVVNAAEVVYCDSAGLGLFLDLAEVQRKSGGAFRIDGLAPRFQGLFHQLEGRRGSQPLVQRAPCRSLPGLVGTSVVHLWQDGVALVAFIGELSSAMTWALFHPRKLRWRDVWLTCEHVGANALPIVGLISFLIGLIIAFQAAIPLGQFGAQNFVADLVAVSLVRELGPLMTAIILAGRSGAAFAAELGTMKVNEEVDALSTMGLPPVRFLVVARVSAAVAMMPFLTMFSMVFGLIGGGVVYLSLGFSYVLYCHQVVAALELNDLLGGLFKAATFGLLVATVGCFRGLQTELGASAVGRSTTRAVVTGITLIVVTDGLFSVIFFLLGI